jgi:hypothetical protein
MFRITGGATIFTSSAPALNGVSIYARKCRIILSTVISPQCLEDDRVSIPIFSR